MTEQPTHQPGRAIDRVREMHPPHQPAPTGLPAARARRIVTIAALVIIGTTIAMAITLSGIVSADRPLPSCRPKPGPDRAAPEDLPYSFPIEPCTWAR